MENNYKKRTLVPKDVVCYNPVKGVLGIKIKEVEKCITQL